MRQEFFDPARDRMALRELAELALELGPVGAGRRLDADDRPPADADERAARDAGVRVEDAFDLLGVERADAVRLAPDVPEPAFGVEPAEVAHAVHDTAAVA